MSDLKDRCGAFCNVARATCYEPTGHALPHRTLHTRIPFGDDGEIDAVEQKEDAKAFAAQFEGAKVCPTCGGLER